MVESIQKNQIKNWVNEEMLKINNNNPPMSYGIRNPFSINV